MHLVCHHPTGDQSLLEVLPGLVALPRIRHQGFGPVPTRPLELIDRIAVHGGVGGIHLDDAEIGIHDQDAFCSAVDDLFPIGFLLSQLALLLFEWSHIIQCSHDPVVAVGANDTAHGNLDIMTLACLIGDYGFSQDRCTAFEYLDHGRAAPGLLFGADALPWAELS